MAQAALGGQIMAFVESPTIPVSTSLPVGGNLSFAQTIFLTTVHSPYDLGVTTHLLNEVPRVYQEVTGGAFSAAGYYARDVVSAYELRRNRDIEAAVLEALCVAGDLADGDAQVLDFLQKRLAA